MSDSRFSRSTKLPFAVDWQWPLQIRLISHENGRDKKIEEITAAYWSEQFFRARPLSKSFSHGNIFLSDIGLHSTIEYLYGSNFPFATDVLVIMENDIQKFLLEKRLTDTKDETLSDHPIWTTLQKLAIRIQASGIFIIPDTNLDSFADNLSIQLSHNLSFPKALLQHEHFFIALWDKDLDRYANLSHYIKRLSIAIGIKKNQRIQKPSAIFEKDDYTSLLLANELYINHEFYDFDHESGIGQPIIHVKEELEKTLGPIVPEAGAAFRDQEKFFDRIRHDHDLEDPMDAADEEKDPPDPADPLDPVELPTATIEKAEKDTPTRSDADRGHRFLQAKINKDASNNAEDSLRYLESHSTYFLHIRMGERNPKWVQNVKAPVNTDSVHKGESKMETIQLVIYFRESDQIWEEKIRLPKEGESTPATIDFKTSEAITDAQISIIAYHNNTILQTVDLQFFVIDSAQKVEPENYIKSYLNNNTGALLDQLNEREDFQLSIHLNENLDTAIVKHSEGAQLKSGSFLEEHMRELTADLEKTAERTGSDNDLFHPQNIKLLRKLARRGAYLYRNLLPEKLHGFTGPIQLMAKNDDYIPIDFLYEFKTPNKDATICKEALKSLENGFCDECSEKEGSKDTVCPMGFWALNRVIERFHSNHIPTKLQNAERYIRALSNEGKKEVVFFDTILFAHSDKINKKKSDTSSIVDDNLDKVSKLIAAKDWDSWKSKLRKKKAETLVLLVHTEPLDGSKHLEIGGDYESILEIDKEYINPFGNKKTFVVLLGCRTSDSTNNRIKLSHNFLNSGASVVLSNFTNIYGRHTSTIMKSIVEYVSEKSGSTTTLGDMMLNVRRKLLAQGLMNCFTLLLEGDATFKVKFKNSNV